MKILVQTVGTGSADRHPVWEALAKAILDRKPDLIVLCCSRLTLEKTVPLIEQSLPDGWPCPHRIQVATNEDDVHVLTREYAQQFDQLAQEFPGAQFEVDFTSGTKAMSAAIVAAAVSREVPYLLYGVGKRDSGGRATETEQHILSSTKELIAEPILDELGRLFNLHQFAAVKQQADHLLKGLLFDSGAPQLRARATSLSFLAEVYGHWDRFDWKAAFARIRERSPQLIEDLKLAGWNEVQLIQQLTYLKKCGQAKFDTPYRLIDLLTNIQRCIDSGYYDDAVCRLYRTFEFICQSRMAIHLERNKSDNPTGKVPVNQIEQLAPESALRICQNFKNKDKDTIDLGQEDISQILSEINDPVGIRINMLKSTDKTGSPVKSGHGCLSNLLNLRNNSWLAHGTTPISSEVAVELNSVMIALAQYHVTDTGGDYHELLRVASFQRCPWVNS